MIFVKTLTSFLAKKHNFPDKILTFLFATYRLCAFAFNFLIFSGESQMPGNICGNRAMSNRVIG